MMFYSIIALSVLLLVVTYLFNWYYKAFINAATRHNAIAKDFHECIKAHDEMVVKYNAVATKHNELLKVLREHGVLL